MNFIPKKKIQVVEGFKLTAVKGSKEQLLFKLDFDPQLKIRLPIDTEVVCEAIIKTEEVSIWGK